MATTTVLSLSAGTAAADEIAALTPSQTLDLFKAANTSVACSQAAQAFARCLREYPDASLAEMLGSLPAEVLLTELCAHIASALLSQGCADPEVWRDLVQSISTARTAQPSRATSEDVASLLVQCARALGQLKIAHQVLWTELLEALPPLLKQHERHQWVRCLATAMVLAGVDQAVLWKRLLAGIQAPTLELNVAALVDHMAEEPASGNSAAEGEAHTVAAAQAAWADTCVWIRLLQIGVPSPFDSDQANREQVLSRVIGGLHRVKCVAPEAWILVLQKLQPRKGDESARPSESLYHQLCACMTTFARPALDNARCAQLFESFANARYEGASALGAATKVTRPGPMPVGQSTLDYLKQNADRFPLTHCTQTAQQIANHLSGKIGVLRFGGVHRFPSAEAYLASSAARQLFDRQSPATLFCIDVGIGAHTFLIERVYGEGAESGFLIYQSWEDLFDLAWWLGKSNSWDDVASRSYHVMRELYGNGKILSRDDAEEHLKWLTTLDPDGAGPRPQITICGAFCRVGTRFEAIEHL
ncbi:MAG: hypothetical protein ABIR26_19955 [Ramlibacter sp.]